MGWHRQTFYSLLKFGDSPTKSMLPYIKAVAGGGVRVWVFRSVDAPASHARCVTPQLACAIDIWLAKQYNCSGDLDAMVPVIATKQSMEKLGLGVVEDWRPWSIDAKDPEVSMHICSCLPLPFGGGILNELDLECVMAESPRRR